MRAATCRSRDRVSALLGLAGFTSSAMTVAAGTSSVSTSSCFCPNSTASEVAPVMLPPGRLRLETSPAATGSPPVAKTIGMVAVAALAASAEGVPPGTAITATLRETRSANSEGNRPYSPSAQRYSNATLRPSTKPVSRKPWWNARRRPSYKSSDSLPRNPITGSPGCARAVTGRAAAPASPAMNSRRLMQKVICPSHARESYRGRIARHKPPVLTFGRSRLRCIPLRGAGYLRAFHHLVDHGAQPHRPHRLVQQMMPALLRLAQPLRRGVAADKECRNRAAECLTQLRDRRNAGLAARQPVIGNDEIGWLLAFERGRCGLERVRGQDPATPTAQHPAHAVEHKGIVFDHHNQFVSRHIGRDGGGNLRRELRLGRCRRHRHCKS